MSEYCLPPYTPLLYSKTGVYRDIHYFLIFAIKHMLWVLVRTASVRLNRHVVVMTYSFLVPFYIFGLSYVCISEKYYGHRFFFFFVFFLFFFFVFFYRFFRNKLGSDDQINLNKKIKNS